MVCHIRLIFIHLMFDNINCDWAHVAIHKGHASLLITRNEEGATSTVAVSIMLACHTVTSINCAKHIAR